MSVEGVRNVDAAAPSARTRALEGADTARSVDAPDPSKRAASETTFEAAPPGAGQVDPDKLAELSEKLKEHAAKHAERLLDLQELQRTLEDQVVEEPHQPRVGDRVSTRIPDVYGRDPRTSEAHVTTVLSAHPSRDAARSAAGTESRDNGDVRVYTLEHEGTYTNVLLDADVELAFDDELEGGGTIDGWKQHQQGEFFGLTWDIWNERSRPTFEQPSNPWTR